MDFNTKDLLDHGYKDQPMLTSNLECFRQEIDTLFYTDPTEVLDSEDWLDIGSLVFDKSVSAEQLKGRIMDLIGTTCLFASEFTYDVDVRFIQGSESDIGIIDVVIQVPGESSITSQYLVK